MDSSLLNNDPQVDVSKLSDSDKRELQQFFQAEVEKSKMQECTPRPLPADNRSLKFSLLIIPNFLRGRRVIES